RDGHVPFYFLVKAGETTKLLQTKGGPEWPRVNRIEMIGEYPFAKLQFLDSELPIEIELSAFSPFAPLDSTLSSLPLAAFTFRIHNKGKESRRVSIAALMQNPIGYEAHGENLTMANACFGANINEILREKGAGGLVMRAGAAEEPKLNRPVAI